MNKSILRSLLIISITTFVAHYLYFREFGLYEDDYFYIPDSFDINLSDVLTSIRDSLSGWPQGRPLLFLPTLFTFIGMKIGGLHSLYIIGYFIITANSILFYFLLKKVFPDSEEFALTGALMFCLFPPDTSKILLAYTYILQISLMFLITASIFYLNGRKKLSYILIIGSLFSYETAFMVFFGIPLLQSKWNRDLKRDLIRHGIILSVILIIYTFVRSQFAEQRIVEMSQNIFEPIYKIAASIFIGPAMNVYLFLRAPAVTIIYRDLNFVIVSGMSLIFFIWVFIKLKSKYDSTVLTQKIKADLKLIKLDAELDLSDRLFKIIKISFASVVFLCLGYILSFTHYPPTVVAGGLTTVHLAATFGGSMLFASIVTAALYIGSTYNLRVYFVIILSVYLSLLVGYRLLIQKDYVVSWVNQKHFWKEVLELCPDINENTLIFVLGDLNNVVTKDNPSSSTYIASNSYADPIVLDQLYNFPSDWKKPPRLFYAKSGFENKMIVKDNAIEWKVPAVRWNPYWETIPDSNVIFLLPEGNQYRRIDTTLTVKDKKINFKTISQPTLENYAHKKLFDYMIDSN